MEGVRLRLVFADRYMLSKSQRTEGLKRSWILLKSHHYTISDLSNYLLDVYDLHDVCPNGLLLSMDGFGLPPFESTSIFKDTDIIRVKKKQDTSLDTTEEIHDRLNNFELAVVEKQPMSAGIKLLADEEFEKETGGYQSKPEDDQLEGFEDTLVVNDRTDNNTVSKKRKESKKLTPMRKRSKCDSTKEYSGAPGDAQNNKQAEKNQSFQQPDVLARHSAMMKKSSNGRQESDKDQSSSADSDTTNGMNIYAPSPKRSCQMQENGERSVVPPDFPDGNKKAASIYNCGRSARRKKAKRQWLREQAKAGKKEPHQQKLVKTDNKKSFGVDNGKCSDERQQLDNSEEDDIIPVVVRPGHIRFKAIGNGDIDKAIQHHEIPETFQWNEITSKKKGQKCSKEKPDFRKNKDDQNLNQESFERKAVEEQTPLNEGDIVAYRLIELSSSWTPELSSFRVGKLSRCDPVSDKVVLMQVPEHPIVLEKDDDAECAVQPVASLYGEDGSLEEFPRQIDYPSLVDVRIIKHANLNKAKAANGGGSEVIERYANPASAVRPDVKVEAQSSKQESGKSNPWDEISKALSAKKAQLSLGRQWGEVESSGTDEVVHWVSTWQ